MGGKQNNVSILAKSIPHRKDFYNAIKQSKESPDEWLSRVKELAKTCSFGKSGDLFILDKFLTGLEPELIDHLCASAKNLNITSSLKIIHAYGAEKIESIPSYLDGESRAKITITEPESMVCFKIILSVRG